MYAERRLAFEKRIGELFNDHKAAYPVRNMSNNAWRDLGGRILSALEDSFQMGRKDTNAAVAAAISEAQECPYCQSTKHDRFDHGKPGRDENANG